MQIIYCCNTVKMLLPCSFWVTFLFVSGVPMTPVDISDLDEVPQNEPFSKACYHKIVGLNGLIYSPHTSQENVTCEWEIDVTSGFTVTLQFELLRLPINEDFPCDFFVEISYRTQNNSITRRICPTDNVEKLNTESQVVIVRYHSVMYRNGSDSDEYGFKIHFTGVAIPKTPVMNNAATILLITVASTLSLALCAFCFSCRSKVHNAEVPGETGRTPNAPTLQQLQDVIEFQRTNLMKNSIHAPEAKKFSFSIFQSQTSSDSSNFRRWGSHSGVNEAKLNDTFIVPPSDFKQERYSIVTTPRSVFPKLSRKWSNDSANRIQHLRTKLVARFSSASQTASDISLFFSATDHDYSQLDIEGDEDELLYQNQAMVEEPVKSQNQDSTSSSISKKEVPSIVIEFVE